MIAGINLLLEPDSPYASDMWKIVTNFMENHPYNPSSDEFSRREAAIVSFMTISWLTLDPHTQQACVLVARGARRDGWGRLASPSPGQHIL
jgi:hypothetical protein